MIEKNMELQAIIEKGKDGLYAVRSEAMIGNSYLGGFGESVEEAKEDFLESILEAIEESIAAGVHAPEMSEIKVRYKYDIPSFFNYFDFINVSRFAAMAGINESKMRQYKTGLAYPGEKTTKKIFSVIQKIGSDISNVSL